MLCGFNIFFNFKRLFFRCGHCKRLKPEFAKAASILAANDPPVALVQVDCTDAGKDTCGRFEVSGYPTVKIFRNGELSSDYSGPRETAGIVKFMKAQVGPASKEVSSADDLAKVLAKPEVVVVSYSKDDEAVFLKVANAMRETVAFAHGATGKEGIVLHRPKVAKWNYFDVKIGFGYPIRTHIHMICSYFNMFFKNIMILCMGTICMND